MHAKFGPWRHDFRIDGKLELVMLDSPIGWRRAVYRIARMFQREFQYDFCQYGYEGREDDPDAAAYLWTYEDFAFGACCFRWREWRNAPHGWALQWVWMHPHERNKGHLKETWPFFRKVFGDFYVEPPLSHAMRAFVGKYHQIVKPVDAAPATTV